MCAPIAAIGLPVSKYERLKGTQPISACLIFLPRKSA